MTAPEGSTSGFDELSIEEAVHGGQAALQPKATTSELRLLCCDPVFRRDVDLAIVSWSDLSSKCTSTNSRTANYTT